MLEFDLEVDSKFDLGFDLEFDIELVWEFVLEFVLEFVFDTLFSAGLLLAGQTGTDDANRNATRNVALDTLRNSDSTLVLVQPSETVELCKTENTETILVQRSNPARLAER